VHVINALIAGTADKFLSGKENYKSAGSVLRELIPLFSGVVFILIVSSAGLIVINKRDSLKSVKNQQENKKVKILLVQQNTDPRKHDYRLSFERLSELTENALSKNGPYDLVVWPESGFVPDVRFWLAPERSGWKRAKLVKEFLDWQKKAAIPLVTGNQDHYYEGEKKHIMNSALYLPPDRKDDFERYYYYKIKLVPFTENFPYGKQFPWIEKLLHNFSTTQWTPGNEYTVFHAPSFKFSTPICFEDTFPGHVRRFVKEGAMILVNMSNDYWANTPLEGYQHGAHAIFRAVENRRPLVRATCSGWTIAVDSEGRILPGWPDFYTEAAYSAELDIPPDKLTFYTRSGDWVPVLSLIIWLAGSGIILLRLLYAEAARGKAYRMNRKQRNQAAEI
jgi:apolipoprotein N-acyltransferase